jgi:hypothetical protein
LPDQKELGINIHLASRVSVGSLDWKVRSRVRYNTVRYKNASTNQVFCTWKKVGISYVSSVIRLVKISPPRRMLALVGTAAGAQGSEQGSWAINVTAVPNAGN